MAGVVAQELSAGGVHFGRGQEKGVEIFPHPIEDTGKARDKAREFWLLTGWDKVWYNIVRRLTLLEGRMTILFDGKEHVRISNAARISGYSKSHIYKLLQAERIEGVKQGTVWFVDIDSLMSHKAQMDNLGSDKYIQWRHES